MIGARVAIVTGGDGAEVGARRHARGGRPEEIASVIHFLASGEASLVTRSIVVADGGVTAR
jgi:NAD(P)-dependent dehydrogenase (short-subunit alcohol dehydrogenase family)